MVKENKIHKIEFRELEPLLKKKLGVELNVVHFSVESLLPPGENYGSSILKVDARVKKTRDAEEETLELVVKMMPPTDIQRLIFDSSYTFRKEAFLYEELIPSYQQLEREFGVKDEEVFDIVPEFYGARYSLRNEIDFDDDAAIVMQNLKVLGYYTGNRREGLDFEHARIALKALARFHALGFAMKRHKPEYFETLKKRCKCMTPPDNNVFEKPTKIFIDAISSDPEISAYSNFAKAAMSQDSAKYWGVPSAESWSTIIHSDFWVNNIMFQKNSDTNIVNNIKFVDFQNYQYLSPLRELIFFFMTSLNVHVMDQKFDELLDLYHENLVELLRRLKCDSERFARKTFDQRLKIDAFVEFPHCAYMLKVMTADQETDDKFSTPEKIMGDKTMNKRMQNRLRMCVKKYAEKDWMSQPEKIYEKL